LEYKQKHIIELNHNLLKKRNNLTAQFVSTEAHSLIISDAISPEYIQTRQKKRKKRIILRQAQGYLNVIYAAIRLRTGNL